MKNKDFVIGTTIWRTDNWTWRSMFPDSEIAESCSCSEYKYANFGATALAHTFTNCWLHLTLIQYYNFVRTTSWKITFSWNCVSVSVHMLAILFLWYFLYFAFLRGQTISTSSLWGTIPSGRYVALSRCLRFSHDLTLYSLMSTVTHALQSCICTNIYMFVNTWTKNIKVIFWLLLHVFFVN